MDRHVLFLHPINAFKKRTKLLIKQDYVSFFGFGFDFSTALAIGWARASITSRLSSGVVYPLDSLSFAFVLRNF